MASTFIANSYQVNFDSVLLISDHDGMLNMFKALEASGWRGFMGCESVVYEKELEQFFDTTLVQLKFMKPVKYTHEVAVKPTDEVDMIIEQVLEETLDLGVSEETQGGQRVDEAAFTDDFGQWLDDYVSRNNEPEIVGTRTFTEDEGSTSPVVEKNIVQAVGSKQVGEEHMSIDYLLMQISEDMILPSVTAAEITKIRFGGPIHIPGVQERDIYYASLPRISIHDKGKAILEEDEPVRGNTARETVELICGDVDFLVQLRDQVMKDVVEFFHSFSLNKLPDLDSLNILKEKEKFMLEWAETDSMEMAVRRRVYILAKYREMLLRKFLESHRKYLVPGQQWTATASQIIDLLSAAHSKSLEVLVTQKKENGLPIEQSCTSTYLDTSIGSGAVLVEEAVADPDPVSRRHNGSLKFGTGKRSIQ
ncbi:hypothetical protein F511_25085 [Dorcoceras hygrometricum]|uniref:Uncharacterized protein n=1 Tax=Dorcoceras hygrometricum TaxID=472368 RepID=A0A2Z7AMW4_9LAMI|nr:hypothetical protein F511_25085 [Dorcoceras hygrometricum]